MRLLAKLGLSSNPMLANPRFTCNIACVCMCDRCLSISICKHKEKSYCVSYEEPFWIRMFLGMKQQMYWYISTAYIM